MARKPKIPSLSVTERMAHVANALEALRAGQPVDDAAIDVVAPMLEFIAFTGGEALDALAAAQQAMRKAPINDALKQLLLFDLARWPLETSADVREKIMSDAKQAVRGKPLEQARAQSVPGGTNVGGKSYGLSAESPYKGALD